MSGKMRRLSEEEGLLAAKLYKERPSLSHVKRKFSCSAESLKRTLTEMGLYAPRRYKKGGFRKYQIDQDYFKSIDSHEKAYFLGYLWADGLNAKYGRSCHTTLSLHHKDTYILEYFRDLIYPTKDKPICFCKRRNKDTLAVLALGTKEVYEDLLSLGMNNRKTVESHIPKIDEQYLMSFTLGYFDGDGCIHLQKYVSKKDSDSFNLCANVSIVSNNTIMDEFINLFRERGIDFYSVPHNTVGYKRIHIYSYRNVKKFYDLVYANQKTFLKRKHDKFVEYFQYKERMFLKHRKREREAK